MDFNAAAFQRSNRKPPTMSKIAERPWLVKTSPPKRASRFQIKVSGLGPEAFGIDGVGYWGQNRGLGGAGLKLSTSCGVLCGVSVRCARWELL